MTANKHFKRRVRERARRTGESYTAALSHLRRSDAQEVTMRWQRIEKTEFGYAVHVPEGWQERQPDLKNSPWETARFVDPADRRHSVIVFRGMAMPGPLRAVEVAERVRTSLEGAGFGDFAISETSVGGRPGARIECAKHDAGRIWAVRQYVVVHEGVRFVLGCGTSVPEEDDPLFTVMSERLEILEPEVS
ncbi:MAG TPA: hypothetical protein VF069_17250 [Streptosporangiaceae bacterium]